MLKNKLPLKIFVDWQPMLGRGSGVAQYIGNIISELEKLDNYNDYSLYAFSLKRKDHSIHNNFKVKFIKFASSFYIRLLKLGLKIPIEFLTFKNFDVYFWGNFYSYPVLKGKSIIVVHDIAHVKYPEQLENRSLDTILKLLPASIDRASKIITPSNTVKKEIIETYNVKEEKVEVIYPLINYSLYDKVLINPFNPENVLRINSKEINTKYILFIGNFEPKKNLGNLVDAYKLLPNSLKEEYKLITVSSLNWKSEDLLKRINEEKDIINFGFLKNIDKANLLINASLLVLPSFYEGFGIPPVEAMYCGVPIAVSDIPVFHEVLNDAPIFFDPKSIDDISSKIKEVLTNENMRQDMIKKGNERMKFIKNLNQGRLLLHTILAL